MMIDLKKRSRNFRRSGSDLLVEHAQVVYDFASFLHRFFARQLIRHGHIIRNPAGMTEERLRLQAPRIPFLFFCN